MPTDLAARALRQGMELRDRLKALTNQEQWVHAVLAMPYGWVDVKGQGGPVWVLNQNDLTKTLENAPRQLPPEQVRLLAKALELLAAHAREVRAARRAPAQSPG